MHFHQVFYLGDIIYIYFIFLDNLDTADAPKNMIAVASFGGGANGGAALQMSNKLFALLSASSMSLLLLLSINGIL